MNIKNLILNTYKLIFIFEKTQYLNFVYLIFLMLIGALLETLSIGLVLPILSSIMNPNLISSSNEILKFFNIGIQNYDQFSLIIYAVVIFFIIYLIKNIFLSYLFWKQSKFIYGLMASVAFRLFKIYIYKPYIFHIENNSSELIRNLTSEMNLFNGAVKSLTVLLTEILVLFGVIFLLLYLQPAATLSVSLVLLIFSSLFYLLIKNNIKKWGEDRQFHERYRIQHLQQSIGGNKEIKILKNEREFINQFFKHNKEWGDIGQKQNFIEAIPRILLEIIALGMLSILIIVLISAGTVIDQLVPIVAMFGAAAFRLIPSMNRTMGALQRLIYTSPVITVIHNELINENKNADSENNNQLKTKKKSFKDWREIRLKNINYKYPKSDNYILKNLDLIFHRGQSIGIIGKSGEGKSTLIDVFLNLLPLNNGEILIDGNKINTDLESWRNEIGYVPQSIFLLDDTLKKNIALGVNDKDINNEKLNKSIFLSQLEDFVTSLAAGYETNVGERGVQISGGQSQRIGIARALYNDPSIIVFDEATSSLDINTESEVMKSIDMLKGDKSIILVTHRLITLKNCDVIYELNNGMLEKKTYDQLGAD